jgi:transcription termination factor Rho
MRAAVAGRRSRFRDRRVAGAAWRERRRRGEREPQVSEDDVLVQVAGIVDDAGQLRVRADLGYLAGPNDVYVSHGADQAVRTAPRRRGHRCRAGAARAASSARDKYNPLVRLDTINGMDPEEARRRPEFYKLTPLYPQERLRLETEPHILTTRVIDLVMPIGKGQRALIVSPPKAGKTMIQQAIANAITHNNPECHLMVVLVDERPEEVTDMQRSVKGEVIASTFDRPPSDHTTVAELAIERAKRLVGAGPRRGRAARLDHAAGSCVQPRRAGVGPHPLRWYRLDRALPAEALPRRRPQHRERRLAHHPRHRAGRDRLDDGHGDLRGVQGHGNAELSSDRKIADKRVFPAIDIDPSGTRKEDSCSRPTSTAIVIKLRRVLHSLDSQAALDLLLDKLKQTRTNIEFLMQIAKTTPGE